MIEYDEFRAMNTTILVAGEGERSALAPGFAQVRQFIEVAEQRFSRFRETSELSALNRAAGQWFPVSEAMFSLLGEADKAYRNTRGFFDPTVLGALKAVGYDRSMDEIRHLELSPVHMNFVPLSPGFDALEFDPVRRAVWMPREMQIDLGGIAKGWIAARATEQLSAYTEAGAVSAGGDMVLFGVPAGEETWPISLEDPRDPAQVLAVLQVGPGAVATSSVTKRRWQQHQIARHHIIDPRTGSPSTSPWLSVTVYTENAAFAEAFAKALLIAGPDEAWALAERVAGLQFVAVEPDGTLTGNFEESRLVLFAEALAF